MKKLKGFENTFYPNRWEVNGIQICELTEKVYLIFTGQYDRIFGIDHERVLRFSTFEDACNYCNQF